MNIRRILQVLGLLLACSAAAAAQTTAFNGVVADLTGVAVASGNVTFTLKPGVDTTISGNARFTPTAVSCVIANPAVVSTSGTTTITVTVNPSQPWQVGDVILFRGTGDATLNGSTVASPYTITGGSGTTYTFTQSGTHTNGAGGTVGGLYSPTGTGQCVVVQSTAQNPANTSYNVVIQPGGTTTSAFNTYAIGSGPIDISTIVPTPSQQPAYSFVDLFSNGQTISGQKTFSNTGNIYAGGTFTGNPNFTGSPTFSGGISTTVGLFSIRVQSPYFLTNSANPATTGVLRLANGDNLCWGVANFCFNQTAWFLGDFPDVKIIKAANCNAAVPGSGWSSSAGQFVSACRAGTNNIDGALQCIPATGCFAMMMLELPKDWDTAAQPYISIAYGSGANTSGTVIWTVATGCTKEDGSVSDDPGWNTESAFAGQTMAVANTEWAQNGQFTMVNSGNNCIPGSPIHIKVALSGTAASIVNVYQAIVTVPRKPVVQAN